MIDEEKIKQGIRLLLEGIGEDADREGLLETPDRIARMHRELYAGMEESAKDHLLKTFHVDSSEMVLEKDITFYSTCEHHLLPFYGKAHIAYIPDGKVVGLRQTGAHSRGICQKATITGTAYRTDCKCADAVYESEGRAGYA